MMACARGARRAQLVRKIARIISAATIALLSIPLSAQPPKPTEYEVKAAYLYNFGKFVRWPESALSGAPPSICVLGKDPFGKTLDATVGGGSWEGRPISTRRITTVNEAAGCSILFISASESDRWAQILPVIEKQPILTVSDAPLFSRHGGMIEFVLSENRVRFEVDLQAAENAGLSLNSQLLKVAMRVRKSPGAGER